MRTIFRGVIAAIGLWTVACGGDDDGEAIVDASPPLDTRPATWQPTDDQVAACRELLGAECNQLAACGESFFDAYEGTLEACIDARLDQCVKEFLPGSSRTPEAMRSCAVALVAADCPHAIRHLSHQAPVAGCEATAGARATGEACDSGAQCASTFCNHSLADTCGVCVDAPRPGDACVRFAVGLPPARLTPASGGICATGQLCVDNNCRTAHDVGEACSATTYCYGDLQCSASATCEPTLADGATCDPFQSFNPCGLGNFCNEQSLVCEPQRAGATTTCGRLVDGGLALCAPGHACLLNGSAGTCVPARVEGEDCSGTYRGPACAPGLVCQANRCRQPLTPAEGELCGS